MLPYFLAIALALGSLTLYLSAFFARDTHRQDDFLWSGVGLFYALILWLCAGQMKGSVLLGQGAAVSLVLVFGWQTIRLRRAIAYPDQPFDLEKYSVIRWFKGRFSGKKAVSPTPQPSPKTETKPQPEVKVEKKETVIVEIPQEAEIIEEIKENLAIPVNQTVIVEEIKEVTKTIKDVVIIEDNPLDEILEDLEGDKEISEKDELEDEDSLDFEPFIVDNEAETVIEAYNPQIVQTIKEEKSEKSDFMDQFNDFMEDLEKNEDQPSKD